MNATHRLTWGLLLTATTAFAQTAQRVGIGTTTPRAGLDLSHNDGFIATGAYGNANSTNNFPAGAGTRLMWVPLNAAFRAGYVENDAWDLSKIGSFSVAMGKNARAEGQSALAVGENCSAEGQACVALGANTYATSLVSTAIGYNTIANGFYSTALGAYASTNGKMGSFVIGDISRVTQTTHLLSSSNHEFSARFAGGYRFFTNAEMTVGVSLAAGGNAWVTISDSTKKTGFRAADGALFLQKIARMRLGSWHYKGQNAKTMRHYGPMAQDFFAAFGHDGVGTVGEETTINQADFDGVNLIAIQALVRENEARKAEDAEQKARLARLETENAELRRLLGQLVADVQALKTTPVAAVSTAAR